MDRRIAILVAAGALGGCGAVERVPPGTGRPAAPVRDSGPRDACTEQRPCRRHWRIAPRPEPRRHVLWATPRRYRHDQVIHAAAWADGQPVPAGPMGSPVCGQHFVRDRVLVGVATFCDRGRAPIRFGFTNVSSRPVDVVVRWYVEAPAPAA